MTSDQPTLGRFIEEVRRLSSRETDERRLLSALTPIVQRFAASRTWLQPHHYEAPGDQGFGAHLLHEEPDHALAILAASFLPGRATPAHDHGTWAIVVAVDGAETNVFWQRVDDGSRPGYAELRPIEEKILNPGEVAVMPAGTIHSVRNDSEQTALSLHVYGKHINFTKRSQFDPERHTQTPFIVKLAPAH